MITIVHKSLPSCPKVPPAVTIVCSQVRAEDRQAGIEQGLRSQVIG
jgi:hypothetical protein